MPPYDKFTRSITHLLADLINKPLEKVQFFTDPFSAHDLSLFKIIIRSWMVSNTVPSLVSVSLWIILTGGRATINEMKLPKASIIIPFSVFLTGLSRGGSWNRLKNYNYGNGFRVFPASRNILRFFGSLDNFPYRFWDTTSWNRRIKSVASESKVQLFWFVRAKLS